MHKLTVVFLLVVSLACADVVPDSDRNLSTRTKTYEGKKAVNKESSVVAGPKTRISSNHGSNDLFGGKGSFSIADMFKNNPFFNSLPKVESHKMTRRNGSSGKRGRSGDSEDYDFSDGLFDGDEYSGDRRSRGRRRYASWPHKYSRGRAGKHDASYLDEDVTDVDGEDTYEADSDLTDSEDVEVDSEDTSNNDETDYETDSEDNVDDGADSTDTYDDIDVTDLDTSDVDTSDIDTSDVDISEEDLTEVDTSDVDTSDVDTSDVDISDVDTSEMDSEETDSVTSSSGKYGKYRKYFDNINRSGRRYSDKYNDYHDRDGDSYSWRRRGGNKGGWNKEAVMNLKKILIQRLRLRMRNVLKSELSKIEVAFKKAFTLSGAYLDNLTFDEVFDHPDFAKLFERNWGYSSGSRYSTVADATATAAPESNNFGWRQVDLSHVKNKILVGNKRP